MIEQTCIHMNTHTYSTHTTHKENLPFASLIFVSLSFTFYSEKMFLKFIVLLSYFLTSVQ